MCINRRNINEVRDTKVASSVSVGCVGAAMGLTGAMFVAPAAAAEACSVTLFGLTADSEQRLVRFKECSPRNRRVIGESGVWR